MIRVLQVFGCLDRGGAESAMMNYYREIDRERIQFDFVTHFENIGAYEYEILGLGGRIFRVPRFTGYNIFQYSWAWIKLFREHREWSIIHVHIFTIAGVILPIAKFCGVRNRIVHCHSTSSPIFTHMQRVVNRSFRYLANRFQSVRLACSRDAGKYYFGANEFVVLHNAIDVSRFTFNEDVRSREREELSCGDSYVIGHVGRFNKPKNHPFIIEIFSEVYKRDPSAKLLLVGGGSIIKEQIEQQVERLGLSKSVIFTGVRSDIPELFQAMDLFLFPSLWEGLGIVTIEAQSAGLPTVISDKVPDAVMITDLAEKISLSETPSFWAEVILKYKGGNKRVDTYEKVRAAGYDIHDNVKWLENFYLNLPNEKYGCRE